MPRVSLRTRAVCAFMKLTMRRSFLTEELGEKTLLQPKTSASPPAWLARQYVVTRREVGGFEVYRVLPRAGLRVDGVAGGATGEDTGRTTCPVTIYLHGGSYVKQIAKQHWRLIADLADATGCPVDVPIYGLAPQHDLAEMVDFVVAVVCGLDGARVRLAGDSAGGGLALLVAQRLRDAGGSPVSSVTVMAPWLDLAMNNPDIDLIEPVDPWLARPAIRPMARAVAGTLRLDDPRVSPVRGSSGNLPPVTVLVGTRDMTLADVRLLRERVLAAGGSIVHESPGSPHVHPLLPTPEGRAARRVFLDAVVAGG